MINWIGILRCAQNDKKKDLNKIVIFALIKY